MSSSWGGGALGSIPKVVDEACGSVSARTHKLSETHISILLNCFIVVLRQALMTKFVTFGVRFCL